MKMQRVGNRWKGKLRSWTKVFRAFMEFPMMDFNGLEKDAGSILN